MRIARVPPSTKLMPPLFPPLLATRGMGSKSSPHAHHAMHLVVCLEGELRIHCGKREPLRGAGVLTAPDVTHALDAEGREVLLVFFDPESHAGSTLARTFEAPLRMITSGERKQLVKGADPERIMQDQGLAWTQSVISILGAEAMPERRVHPRVRKALKLLRDANIESEPSLEDLARAVSLSPGRFMHAFTESLGSPLRPYLAWLKLQRAAAAIVSGTPLVHAAQAAGFADAAHMSRTFRRMLGMTPSALRSLPLAGSPSGPPRSRL